MWTINDFPMYGNLVGCTTKGKKLFLEQTFVHCGYRIVESMYTWSIEGFFLLIILIVLKRVGLMDMELWLANLDN